MANLQISVFSDAREVAFGVPLQEEIIVIGGTSLQSSVLTGSRTTHRIRIYAEANCFVTWGLNPTALQDGTEGRFIGADNPEYFGIPASFKIAVIERV